MKVRTLAIVLMLTWFSPHEARAAKATFQIFSGGVMDITPNGEILLDSESIYSTTSALYTPNPPNYTDIAGLGGTFTVATSISRDGTVVAGYGTTSSSAETHAWIKRPGKSSTDIGTLGGNSSLAWAISADGNTLAGESVNAHSEYQGFRWTASSGMTPIGFLSNSNQEYAGGMSGDGNIIVGTAIVVCPTCDPGHVAEDCNGDCGPPVAMYNQAFVWTKEKGRCP